MFQSSHAHNRRKTTINNNNSKNKISTSKLVDDGIHALKVWMQIIKNAKVCTIAVFFYLYKTKKRVDARAHNDIKKIILLCPSDRVTCFLFFFSYLVTTATDRSLKHRQNNSTYINYTLLKCSLKMNRFNSDI